MTNLLESLDLLTHSLAYKRWIDVIFLDFAKAFDKVPHSRLVHKLQAYGISGELLAWLTDFLSNRRQRVVLGENVSNWESVTSGVPQGSVLGPILFVIYINDLPSAIEHFPCKLYADDCKILAEMSELKSPKQLQDDLDRIVQWTETWLMKLNYSKCKVMHIGKKNQCAKYTINDRETGTAHELTVTESERDLGITITDDLKWHTHAITIASKANSILGWFKSVFMCRDVSLWTRLYSTYIRPHLEFAAPAWNVYLKGDIDALEKIQRRATKVPHELRRFDYATRLKLVGLTRLDQRRERGDCIQAFKLAKNLEVVDWHAPLETRAPMWGYRERTRQERVKNCMQRLHFFSNRVADKWNALPDSTVIVNTVNQFKSRYDSVARG